MFFTFQAEIEHFMDPEDKSHHKFAEVKETKVRMYSAAAQCAGTEVTEISVREALEKRIIFSETMG